MKVKHWIPELHPTDLGRHGLVDERGFRFTMLISVFWAYIHTFEFETRVCAFGEIKTSMKSVVKDPNILLDIFTATSTQRALLPKLFFHLC